MNFYLKKFIVLIFMGFLIGCNQTDDKNLKIGIVVPMEHPALQEIVAGFKETLPNVYPYPISIKIKNAQNDLNLQRAIIQQMRDEHIKMVVPIGTDVTQMTRAMIQHQPIVSLAADFSEMDRKTLTRCNIAIVHDRIPMQQLITFIHKALPDFKNLTLIHSASDKIAPDVKEVISAAKQYHITITPIMAQTLPDLTHVAKSIPKETDAILVLKDNLIISGIATLVKAAKERQIPLITGDQLSVQHGASFALGFHERAIGVEGALLAAAILQGKAPCDLPIVEMKQITLFVNSTALKQIGQDESNLSTSAKAFNFALEQTEHP